MSNGKNERQSRAKVKFREGGPDDIIYLLHLRGDKSQAISDQYGLTVEEVDAAIDRCRKRKRKESGETFSD